MFRGHRGDHECRGCEKKRRSEGAEIRVKEEDSSSDTPGSARSSSPRGSSGSGRSRELPDWAKPEFPKKKKKKKRKKDSANYCFPSKRSRQGMVEDFDGETGRGPTRGELGNSSGIRE